MDRLNHLGASIKNYRKCIYALAAREYSKALSWIIVAIKNINQCIESGEESDMSALYARRNEYEKLKNAIENGAMTARSEQIPPAAVNLQDKRNQQKTKYNLTFDDVVGLDHVKEAIKGAIVYPFKYADVYKAFRRKSGGGILLYGAPGTGKTMIAKAIAGEIDAEFISVNCSDIYSKWLGESQQNIRKVFGCARQAKRAVIFFDEFEALGRSRSSDSVDSGPNDVVCELLAQVDGCCSDANSTILVIAATNRPWDIDSALRRSGRFERHLYVEMPDEKARIAIIHKHIDELPMEALCYEELGKATEGFSPADVAHLCDLVKDRAIMRSIESNSISSITQEDFVHMLSQMHTTVSPIELQRLQCFV